MNDVTLLNESGMTFSDSLRDRLTTETRGLPERLAREGHSTVELAQSVVVLLLPEGDPSECIVIPKAGLRAFIANVRMLYRGKEQPPDIKESLIQRCLAQNPAGCLRVLFISQEMCGSLQVHTGINVRGSSSDEGTGSRLRLHDREPLMYNGSYSSTMRSVSKEEEQKLTDVTEVLLKSLKKYPQEVAKDVLEQVHRENEDLMELRNAIARDEAEMEEIEAALAKLLPTFRERWLNVRARARKAPLPPTTNTAGNVEALVMAATYVFEPVYSFPTDIADPAKVSELISGLIGFYSRRDEVVLKVLKKMDGSLRGRPFATDLQDFGVEWMRQGFPKLEVGHKLAATLAMTDVPDDIEVLPPWKAWSLVIPPGLFGDTPGSFAYSRMWLRGTEVLFLIGINGEIQGPLNDELITSLLADKKVQSVPAAVAIIHAMQSLVKGACLALSNPDDYKRQSLKDKATSSKKPPREGEVPDFTVNRFMLSAPVQIDVRQHLLDYVRGKKTVGGTGPKVQFFVRGHWRNQAHGPRMSLRKQMRIEGYWKGPEHGAIKLGNYKVRDEEDDKPEKDES